MPSSRPTSSVARRRRARRRSRFGRERHDPADERGRPLEGVGGLGGPVGRVGVVVVVVLVGPGRLPRPGGRLGRPVDVAELRAGAVEQLGDERRGALLDGRAAVGREDQAVLRPGHRDVQEAALLVGVDVADGDGLAQELGREEAAAVLAGRPLPVEQARDDDVAGTRGPWPGRGSSAGRPRRPRSARRSSAARRRRRGRRRGRRRSRPACRSGWRPASRSRSAGSWRCWRRSAGPRGCRRRSGRGPGRSAR